MEKLETVLLILLYWTSGQGDAETKTAFRWHNSVEECQANIGAMDKGLKEKHGPSMMTRGVCLDSKGLDALNPDLPENKQLIP